MMDTENQSWEEQQKKNKRRGAIISGAIHVIILVLFLFFGLSSAFPPPIEGILVNFGTTLTGSGDEPSEVKDQPKEISPTETSQSTSVPEKEESPAAIVTQDAEETFAVKNDEKDEQKKEPEKKTEEKPRPEKKDKKPDEEEEIKPEKEEQKVDTKSLYTGQQSDKSNPNNEGELYTPGDRGDPDGDATAKNHEGDSKGIGNIGVGYDLAGRNLLTIPPIDESYKETGKVVLSIKVNRNGKVIFARYTVKGSTTTDPKLIRLAEEAARQAKFNANSKAAEEQFGSITFTFKLK